MSDLTWTIGTEADGVVPVVFTFPDGRTHTRNVNAAATPEATAERVADVARGVAVKAAAGAITLEDPAV